MTMLQLFSDTDFGIRRIDRTISLGSRNPINIIVDIINSALGLLGILAVVMIILGGFLIMLSGSNEERRQKGFRTLVNAIIGLILILSSYAIVNFILNSLVEATGTGITF